MCVFILVSPHSPSRFDFKTISAGSGVHLDRWISIDGELSPSVRLAPRNTPEMTEIFLKGDLQRGTSLRMVCHLKVKRVTIYIHHRFISSGSGAYRIPHLSGKTTEKVKTEEEEEK